MFDDEEKIVMAARRWYAAVKRNKDPRLTRELAIELAGAVVLFERGRGLRHLKPKTSQRRSEDPR